jgi:mono/diheme cytochrome c family protein
VIRWLGIGALALALAASIGLNIAVRMPKTRPAFEYFPNMAHSVRYNAFEENPNFADGTTLRGPVAGTIPRGLPPLRFGEDAAPLANPFSADDRQAAARGEVVFTNFCQPCHGANGEGEGLVVKHGFPPPPPLSRDQTRQKTDAQLFQILTNGQNTMPSHRSQISRDDRWKAILHLRTLARSK